MNPRSETRGSTGKRFWRENSLRFEWVGYRGETGLTDLRKQQRSDTSPAGGNRNFVAREEKRRSCEMESKATNIEIVDLKKESVQQV